MGIRLIGSSDSRDSNTVRINSTPDPIKFEVVKIDIVNGYPILLVNYPNVVNYEGDKILMYEKNFDLRKIANHLDPHFFTAGDSPIARFEPTDYGWELAITLAKAL